MRHDLTDVGIIDSSAINRQKLEDLLLKHGFRAAVRARGLEDFRQKPGHEAIRHLLVSREFLREGGALPSGVKVISPDLGGQFDLFEGALEAFVFGQIPDLWEKLPRSLRCSRRPMVFLGSSTGGPAALELITPKLELSRSCYYVCAQHMPMGQTKGLVEHLVRLGVRAEEVSHGKTLVPGVFYVLPSGSQAFAGLRSTGEVAFYLTSELVGPLHAPLIDLALFSVAQIFQDNLVAGILTGMGTDGALGLLHGRRRGGLTFAQSQASSLVYGMPKAALETGKAQELIDLTDVARYLNSWTTNYGRGSHVG